MNDAEFERVLRECTPEVLATLVRRGGASGDLGMAEDALQEAVLSAARQWPTEAVPDNPR
nr:RNA polymerase sigma factor [Actinomycetota bacterium]